MVLSDLLADEIRNAGGRILLRKLVEKITVKGKTVTGVKLSDGTTIDARAVASNANAPDTFFKMLPKNTVPKRYLEKLSTSKPTLSMFIIWLGLNKVFRNVIRGYVTHISSGQGSEKDYQYYSKGKVEYGSFSVTLYDNLYEGYSKPGTSTMVIAFPSGYGFRKKYEQDYKTGRKVEYYKEKKRWSNILIERVERHLCQELAPAIEVVEAAMPLTNWRYTLNKEGAMCGYEHTFENSYTTRLDNKTPIRGLYLASAWGKPGGGYNGSLKGGEIAFQMMMENWGGQG